jgi:hypothetical protein
VVKKKDPDGESRELNVPHKVRLLSRKVAINQNIASNRDGTTKHANKEFAE